MVGVVQAHPSWSCGVVALGAAMGAMVHAETSLVSALPWGAAEAVAVMAGYCLLGPWLGMRHRSTVPAVR